MRQHNITSNASSIYIDITKADAVCSTHDSTVSAGVIKMLFHVYYLVNVARASQQHDVYVRSATAF